MGDAAGPLPPIAALHTAARRYCLDREARLGSLDRATRTKEEAVRDRAARALRVSVETTTPADFGSLEEARRALAEAGLRAETPTTRWLSAQREAAADNVAWMDDERLRFGEFIATRTQADLAAVEPLPFRRVLRDDEVRALWTRLCERWRITQRSGYWYPVYAAEGIDPDAIVAFDATEFAASFGDDRLRMLLPPNAQRAFVLEEDEDDSSPSCEMEMPLLRPSAHGTTECWWFDATMDWVVYASHESSLTIAGRELVAAVKAAWPKWKDAEWRGV